MVDNVTLTEFGMLSKTKIRTMFYEFLMIRSTFVLNNMLHRAVKNVLNEFLYCLEPKFEL